VLQRIEKVPKALFRDIALTYWLNGEAIQPAVRSRKEAFPDGKARKSPHMSPIFDLKSKGLRALRCHP